MQYTILDQTNLRVSRMALGTASLHHLLTSGQRQQLLCEAHTMGITHFDTSPYYGYGLAESELGVFIRHQRDLVTVTTKVGLYPKSGMVKSTSGLWVRKLLEKSGVMPALPDVDWCIQRAMDSFHASLKRLKTDYVDFLLLHEPNMSLIGTDQFTRWVQDLQQQGKIRYWGLAGIPTLLEPWLKINHPLSVVLQTQDHVLTKSADFMLNSRAHFQFTYGYLSSVISATKHVSFIDDIVPQALLRNRTGSLLFSTRSLTHLKQLVRYCE